MGVDGSVLYTQHKLNIKDEKFRQHFTRSTFKI